MGVLRTSRVALLQILLGASMSILLPASALGQRDKKPQEPPKSADWFEGELAKAQSEAVERNVPVVICCVLEGEEANSRFRRSLNRNPAFAKLGEFAILIVANDGNHPQKEIQEPGPDGKPIKRTVCSAFGTDDCESHRRQWDAVYKEFVMPFGGEWSLPEAIVVRPDWTIFNRFGGGQPPSITTMQDGVQVVQALVGMGIRSGDLARVRGRAVFASSMAKAKLWADSWRAWFEVSELAPAGPHAKAADEGLVEAGRQMARELAVQEPRLVVDTLEDAYRRILDLGFKGSPLEKKVKTIVAKARRDRDLKKLLAAIDLAMLGEALLEEITAAVDEEDLRQAKRLLRRLYAGKLGKTPAAALARERFSDLLVPAP